MRHWKVRLPARPRSPRGRRRSTSSATFRRSPMRRSVRRHRVGSAPPRLGVGPAREDDAARGVRPPATDHCITKALVGVGVVDAIRARKHRSLSNRCDNFAHGKVTHRLKRRRGLCRSPTSSPTLELKPGLSRALFLFGGTSNLHDLPHVELCVLQPLPRPHPLGLLTTLVAPTR